MSFVGVISDTHGLLRPEAIQKLEGAALILHAGDVGGPDLLDALAQVAPVRAVRGNTDGGTFGSSLPITDVVDIGAALGGPPDRLFAYVLHQLAHLDLEPAAAGFRAVVYGHTHRPAIESREDVLYVNPGAAGHRRFDLPVTVGRLRVDSGEVVAEIVHLEVAGA